LARELCLRAAARGERALYLCFMRPLVLVTELGGDARSGYDTRMHIALTRATVEAVVVATPEELACDHLLATIG